MWRRTALSWHWSCRAASTRMPANCHWNGRRTNGVSSSTWSWRTWASKVSSPIRTAIHWKTLKSSSMVSNGNQFARLLVASFGDYYCPVNIVCKRSVSGKQFFDWIQFGWIYLIYLENRLHVMKIHCMQPRGFRRVIDFPVLFQLWAKPCASGQCGSKRTDNIEFHTKDIRHGRRYLWHFSLIHSEVKFNFVDSNCKFYLIYLYMLLLLTWVMGFFWFSCAIDFNFKFNTATILFYLIFYFYFA